VKTRLHRAFILFAGVAVASPAFAQGKKEADFPDTITTKSGDKKKAEVLKLDAKEVVFKAFGEKKDQKLSWNDVRTIEYGGFPSDLASAEGALERRDYSKAEGSAEDAIKACQEGKSKELFLARAQIAKARALRGLGRAADAAQIADAALQTASGNYYAKDASIEKVWALCDAGSADVVKAGEDAKALQDSFGEEFLYDIDILIGTYYEKQKDPDNALKNYGMVASERRDVQDRAELGKARVKILQNNPDGACDAFRKILATATDPAAIAGASVGLGDATKAKLDSASDKPAFLREVLNIYLRGVVLAYPMGAGPTDNHEASLRKAAETCELIVGTVDAKDKSEKALAARKFYLDYARKLYEELTHTYPNAQDVEKIHEKVGKLKQESQALAAQEKPSTPAGEH
jgi:hypothetical protein